MWHSCQLLWQVTLIMVIMVLFPPQNLSQLSTASRHCVSRDWNWHGRPNLFVSPGLPGFQVPSSSLISWGLEILGSIQSPCHSVFIYFPFSFNSSIETQYLGKIIVLRFFSLKIYYHEILKVSCKTNCHFWELAISQELSWSRMRKTNCVHALMLFFFFSNM